MEKDLVEIRMQSEYHFRRSCRELMGQDTGNDFWKRCFCEACFQAIREEVTGEWSKRNTPFDVELYRDKLLVVEGYRQQYVQCVPHLIDLQGMLTEYRKLRKRYRYPGLPEQVQLRMSCGYCLHQLTGMTPVRFLHSDEFLGWVQKMGVKEYAARMEVLYHVWKHIGRQVIEKSGGKR